MFRLKDNFRPNAPISQVPASWFNAVASFLNNLIGGYGVKINKNGPFPVISLDPEVLKKEEQPLGEYKQIDSGFSLSQTSLAGRKDDSFHAGSSDGKGVKCYLCFRGAVDGLGKAALYWREVTITRDGRILGIAPEDDQALQVYHSTE